MNWSKSLFKSTPSPRRGRSTFTLSEGELSHMAPVVRSPFTLKYTCLIKLGILLWDSIDVMSYNSPHAGTFTLIRAEQDVQFKADHFFLPVTLRKDLQGVIKMVGAQIEWWLEFHRYERLNVSVLANRYAWTSRGRLDKEKTIRALMGDLQPRDAFALACLHCLEPEVTSLWEQLTPEDRRFEYQNVLYICWGYSLENNHPFIYELQCPPICFDNELALRYVFSQSSREIKIAILKQFVYGYRRASVEKDTLFLRSQTAEAFHRLFEEIGAEDRKNFLNLYKTTVLLYFTHWFCPEEFFAVLDHWSPTEQEVQLLTSIVLTKRENCCLYQPLLDRLLEKYPSTNSRYIRGGACNCHFS